MENNRAQNTKKKHFNARWVLVFSCVIMLSVMITFGMTMAYFGGRSNGLSGEFQLKAGITLKDKSGTDYQKLTIDGDYMVPGTTLTSFCLVTVTSGVSEVSGVFNENMAVNGLMRVQFSVGGDMKGFISVSDKVYNVYKGTTKSAMTDSNLVCKLIKHPTDGYWYFVDKDATAVNDSTMLYDIPCLTNGGVVSMVFNVDMTVSNTSSESGSMEFTHDNTTGKTAQFAANYKVIQSEFYTAENGKDPLDQNYKNAVSVFNAGY